MKPVRHLTAKKFMWIEEENFNPNEHAELSQKELEQRLSDKTIECVNSYNPVFATGDQLNSMNVEDMRRYVAACIIDPRCQSRALTSDELINIILANGWFEGADDDEPDEEPENEEE